MRTIQIFLYVTMVISISFSQRKWDGEGDGKSWNDANNWEGDTIPMMNEIAEISKNVVLSGTQPHIPSAIKISGKAKVEFLMNLSVGNTTSNQNAVIVGGNSHVIFGSETDKYNITIISPTNKNGLNNGLSADSAIIQVMKEATITFSSSNNAINMVAPHTHFQNHGTIIFDNTVKNGIKTNGAFQNYGMIHGKNVISDCIQVNGGNFLNEAGATIKIDQAGDDGIEVLLDGAFNNAGNIEIGNLDLSGTAKNGLAIGSADTLGRFINLSSGIVTINGGSGANLRSIYVYELGDFVNAGIINISGGDPSASLYTRNKVTNSKNGIINLDNSRINVNKGSLLNYGLIDKKGSGQGIFSGDSLNTIINYAFFRYDSSGVFAGGKSILLDQGLKLNSMYRAKIDAISMCTVNIANHSYDYYINNELYGTTDDTGLMEFKSQSLLADSITMTTTIPKVSIKIVNICEEAVKPNFTKDLEQNIDFFQIIPNMLTDDQAAIFQIKNADAKIKSIRIISSLGQLSGELNMDNLQTIIPNSTLSLGINYVVVIGEKQQWTARIVKQ